MCIERAGDDGGDTEMERAVRGRARRYDAAQQDAVARP